MINGSSGNFRLQHPSDVSHGLRLRFVGSSQDSYPDSPYSPIFSLSVASNRIALLQVFTCFGGGPKY